MKKNSIAELFIALLWLAAGSGICRATIYFENTGTTNGWTTLWHERGNLLQTNSPTYKGPTAVRCETIYSATYGGRYHTELRKSGMAALGMDRYYGFAFYLPPNWEFDPQNYNIQQFIANVSGCSGGQPATMTRVNGHSLITRIVTGPDGCTRTAENMTVVTNVTAGVWHTIVLHGNWQATNTGVFEFWYDGVRKINKTGVPTIPNDDTVFNLAVGNYSNGWHDDGYMVGTQGTRDIYIDHVRVTDNYAEADPAAWFGPADNGQFAMSVNASADSLTPGSNIVYNLQVVPFNGFSSNVTLSVSGLPPNTTAVFNPTNVAPSNSSVLTLTAAVNTVPGDYNLILTGTSGALTVTQTIPLTVNELAPTADTFFVASDNAYVLRSATTTVENSAEVFQVKRLADSNTRVSYIRFNLGWFLNTHSATGATQVKLHLYIPGATSGGGNLSVFGLLDTIGGTNGFDSRWSSASMTWNNQPAKTASPNDIPNSSTALPNTNTTAALASVAIPSTAGEFIVSLDPAGFTDLLTNDSNQQLTLALVNNSATIVSFASVANTGGYLQPTLEIVNPVSDFSMSLLPAMQSAASGTNATVVVTIAGTNGFSSAATLSVDGLPQGITANFSSNSISGSGSATLTFNIAPDVDPATYIIPVTASSGSIEHSTNVALTVYSADSDGDGIPDWWMLQTFGHATGQAADKSRATDDADGDGMNNLAEYLCGTDPTDADSYLRMISVTKTNGDVSVSWMAVGGRSYVVEAATNLNRTNNFNAVSPQIDVGNAGETPTTFLDAGAGTNSPLRLYRVRLAQ